MVVIISMATSLTPFELKAVPGVSQILIYSLCYSFPSSHSRQKAAYPGSGCLGGFLSVQRELYSSRMNCRLSLLVL